MIDKQELQDVIDGRSIAYQGEETFPAGAQINKLIMKLEEVTVRVYASSDNDSDSLSIEMDFIHTGRTFTSYIDNWEWVEPKRVDTDALYYLALALPTGVLERLIESIPDLVYVYYGTLTNSIGTIAIIHDPTTNTYISIYRIDDHPFIVRQSYGVARVPELLYPLAQKMGMSVISDIPVPLHLLRWRGAMPGDTFFI